MRLLPSFLAVVMLLGTSAQAFTLVCKVTPIAEGNAGDIYPPTSRTILESWMAPEQAFIIDLKKETVIAKQYNVITAFDFADKKVIRWSFTGTNSHKGKITHRHIIYKYSYFRKNKKLIATIDFGGLYANIRGSRPKCVEH
jgi:hypothetical protein